MAGQAPSFDEASLQKTLRISALLINALHSSRVTIGRERVGVMSRACLFVFINFYIYICTITNITVILCEIVRSHRMLQNEVTEYYKDLYKILFKKEEKNLKLKG